MQEAQNLQTQNKDELDELLQQLDDSAGQPRPEYAAQLEQAFNQAVEYANNQVQTSGFWANLSRPWAFAAILFSVFGVLAVIFLMRPSQLASRPSQALPENEVKQVLTDIFINNPQALLNINDVQVAPPPRVITTTTSSATSSTTASTTSTTSSQDPDYAAAKSFNYSYVKSTIEVGAAAAKCMQFANLKSGSYEEYMFSLAGEDYIKTLEFNKQKQLQDYYLITPQEIIHFRNGDFAALQDLRTADERAEVGAGTTSSSEEAQPLDQPVQDLFLGAEEATSATTSSSVAASSSSKVSELAAQAASDLAVDFFGEGVNVSLERLPSGKEIYVLRVDKQVDCVPVDSATKSNQVELISLLKIDSDNYKVIAEERYLDTISQETLIRVSTSEQQTETLQWSDVASIFEFEYKVPTVPIEHSVPTSEDAMRTFLHGQFELILPDLNKSELVAVDILSSWSAYLDFPTFYPQGEEPITVWEQLNDTTLIIQLKSQDNIAIPFTYELTVARFNPLTQQEQGSSQNSDLEVQPEIVSIKLAGKDYSAVKQKIDDNYVQLEIRLNDYIYTIKCNQDLVDELDLFNLDDPASKKLLAALLQTVLPTLAEKSIK